MELPEPAAELWARTSKAVREHLEQLTGSPSGMRLGGGTVLGAQWHHRLSFDIDITVDERTPLGLLDKRLDATTGQGIEIIEHAAELATGGTSRTVYEESNGVPTVWKSNRL